MTTLQVGLLGSARTLQSDLERIAGRADTNDAEGLHYILQGQSPRLSAHHNDCSVINALLLFVLCLNFAPIGSDSLLGPYAVLCWSVFLHFCCSCFVHHVQRRMSCTALLFPLLSLSLSLLPPAASLLLILLPSLLAVELLLHLCLLVAQRLCCPCCGTQTTVYMVTAPPRTHVDLMGLKKHSMRLSCKREANSRKRLWSMLVADPGVAPSSKQRSSLTSLGCSACYSACQLQEYLQWLSPLPWLGRC